MINDLQSFFPWLFWIFLLSFLLKSNSFLFFSLYFVFLCLFYLSFHLFYLTLEWFSSRFFLFHLLSQLIVSWCVRCNRTYIVLEGLRKISWLFLRILYGKENFIKIYVHLTMRRIMSFWTRYCLNSLSFSFVLSSLLRMGCSVLLSTLYILEYIYITYA